MNTTKNKINHNLFTTLGMSLAVTIIGISLQPRPAQAAVIVQQPVSSFIAQTPYNHFVTFQGNTVGWVELGSGFTATPQSLTVLAYPTGTYSNTGFQIANLMAYTDGTYTTGSTTCSFFPQVAFTGTQQVVALGTCPSMVSGEYYALSFSNGGNQEWTAYGSGQSTSFVSGYNFSASVPSSLSSDGSITAPAFSLNDDSSGGLPISTGFITVTPDATTTATTTTVGFTARIAPSDYVSGTYVHVDFVQPLTVVDSPNVIDACNVFGIAKCSLDFPITASSSDFFYASSTTVTFNYAGTIKATWSIRTPSNWSGLWLIGGLFAPNILATRPTSFVVGYQSSDDFALNGDGTQLNPNGHSVASLLAVGNPTVDNACSQIFTGSTTACLLALIIPDASSTATDWGQLYSGTLVRWPFGYITRFMTIISGNAGAVEPPPLTYTFGSSSPSELQGRSYSVQIWDAFGSSSPILLARADDGSNKNIWDIVMPWFNDFIILGLLVAILSDLFGFEMYHDATQEKNMRDTSNLRTDAIVARAKDRERGQRDERAYQSRKSRR